MSLYDRSGNKNPNYNKHWDNNFKQKMKDLYSKTYSIVTPEGKKIIFKNLREFSRVKNLNIGHLSMLRRGIVKTCKGYTQLFLEPA